MQYDDDPEADAPTLSPTRRRSSGSGDWELEEIPPRPHDPPGVRRFGGRSPSRSHLDEVDKLLGTGDWG